MTTEVFKLPLPLTVLVVLTAAAAPVRDDPGLSGAEACGACHAAALASWQRGPHGAALDTLPEDRRADARCIGCHTLGSSRRLRGVQCESCHGPADLHPVRPEREHGPIMPVPEAACRRCHTPDAPRLFEPGRDLARLPHTGPRP